RRKPSRTRTLNSRVLRSKRTPKRSSNISSKSWHASSRSSLDNSSSSRSSWPLSRPSKRASAGSEHHHEPAPLEPWGPVSLCRHGTRVVPSQGDAVGLAPAAAPEGEIDGVGAGLGLGLELGLGLGPVSGGATVSACLRGQPLFQHTASVWSPTVVSAGTAAVTLKPPLWSAVNVASS